MAVNSSRSHLVQGWIIWAVASLFVFYQFLLQNSPSVMGESLMYAFHTDAAGIGFLSSSFFYTYLVLQIPSGLLVDWIGARRLLVYGPAACGAAAAVFGMTAYFSIAFVSRMFMGLVTAPAVACVLYLSIRYLPPRLFGLAAGLTEMMGMMGGMGEAGLGLGIEHMGWRFMMFVCAVLGLGLSCLMYVLIPASKAQDQANNANNTYVNYTLAQRLFAVIKQPQAWVTGAIAGCVFTLVTAFAGLWCVPYLKALYGISNGQAGWGSAAVFLGVAIGAPVLGALGEQANRTRLFLFGVLMVAMTVLATIIYWPPQHFSLMLISLFIAGFLAGVYIVPFSLISAYAPHYAQATAIGFMNMMLIIGGPILQPIIGHILELEPHSSYQAFQVALTSVLVCFALAFLMVFTLKIPNNNIDSALCEQQSST